ASERTYTVVLLCASSAATKAPVKGWPSGPFSWPLIIAATAGDANEIIDVRESSTLSIEGMSPPVVHAPGRFFCKSRAWRLRKQEGFDHHGHDAGGVEQAADVHVIQIL